MMERLSSRHIVLLGIGHTNAHLLRMWTMNPLPQTDLTCISDHGVATYSGMMPAVLAGQVDRHQMEIDLVRLCASAGARLLTDRVVGIDHSEHRVLFADRPPLPFDALSIGIGSIATRDGVHVETANLIEVKPMQSFLDRLRSAVEECQLASLRVCVVGGGVAGVEISTCLPGFLQRVTDRPFTITLLTSDQQILSSVNSVARRIVERELNRRGVRIRTGAHVRAVNEAGVELSNRQNVVADLVIWATGAAAPPLLEHLGLELCERGFIKTDSTLRALSTDNVFAVGDTGTIVGQDLPKAGVYAVRQGPVLWENIKNLLDRRELKPYVPQRSFLKLINLGDGRAVGAWRGMAVSGRNMMRWKDWIDRRFVERYQVTAMEQADDSMPCHGCGCKLGSDPLEAGLATLDTDGPEDAAIIGESGSDLLATTDFFSSPVDDPYLAGRIAAIHSATDLVASGAAPIQALANVVIPDGDPKDQQQVLREVMAGAGYEFSKLGATIVGGHTIVGPQLETGFTVIGKRIGSLPIRKGNLMPGDQLFVTKPLGSGILLAAHMRSQCRFDWYQSLIESMLSPQFAFAHIIHELGITAATDVTGFGLAGHLREMLTASGMSAEIQLDRIPRLSGVDELIQQGIESSLAPANRQAESIIDAGASLRGAPAYQVLFDPQTCGGLLIGVSPDRSRRFQQAAKTLRLAPPVEIGIIVHGGSDQSRFSVVG